MSERRLMYYENVFVRSVDVRMLLSMMTAHASVMGVVLFGMRINLFLRRLLYKSTLGLHRCKPKMFITNQKPKTYEKPILTKNPTYINLCMN